MTRSILLFSLSTVLVLAGCKRSIDSKLVGSWRWKSCDDAGDVDYRKDHTFTSREWAVTYTHQPAMLFDTGEWHIHGDKLVMDFKGDSHPPNVRHAEFPIMMFDENTLLMRSADKTINTFERVQ